MTVISRLMAQDGSCPRKACSRLGAEDGQRKTARENRTAISRRDLVEGRRFELPTS